MNTHEDNLIDIFHSFPFVITVQWTLYDLLLFVEREFARRKTPKNVNNDFVPFHGTPSDIGILVDAHGYPEHTIEQSIEFNFLEHILRIY